MMDMGYADLGGGPSVTSTQTAPESPDTGNTPAGGPAVQRAGRGGRAGPDGRPRRPADVRVDLIARQEQVRVGDRELDGFTLNNTTPGPQIRARQGQLVEVRLHNASVAAGTTLHWHGLDVPNAMDRVAGVTQDAVPVGGEFVYRFVADQPGTFWYHAHQVSNTQVAGGLFGSLVVVPPVVPDPDALDVVALAHTYAGTRTINGRASDLHVPAAPGQRVRLRIANTDNASMPVWASVPFRVLAVDGTDLHGLGLVEGRTLSLAAGARADLEVTAPDTGHAARVQLSKATAVVLGPASANAAGPTQPTEKLDLLTYGTPTTVRFDPARADRHFDYVIGRRPGFVRGRPGMWWSINGHLYPHVPMFVVADHDVVTMRIQNRSSEVHPMHLHGHHLLVLSRDGRPSTGSPWRVDSIDVLPQETYEVAFVADNPGIWMDHCHQLKHAADGMVAHRMYAGVDTPYRIGESAGNAPE